MDSKDSGKLGGIARRDNMSPKARSASAKHASKASWGGHEKGNLKCPCRRCKKKKPKAKK